MTSGPHVALRQARFAAVDVHYPESGGARAALVLADDRRFETIVDERVHWLAEVAPYEPGRFFVRELPAVQAVLADAGELDLVIIDVLFAGRLDTGDEYDRVADCRRGFGSGSR